MKNFGKFCFAMLLATVGMINAGFIGSKIWNWFVYPNFPGTIEMNIRLAIGLMILVSFATRKIDTKTDESTTEEMFGKWVLVNILRFVILGMAYLVYIW